MTRRALCFGILHRYSTLWMKSRAEVLVRSLEGSTPPSSGRRRVYILLNHSTSYDIVALMHVASRPFTIMMDRGAFTFPVIRHVLSGAGFVPLDGTDSTGAVTRCIRAVEQGDPLLISLHEGGSTLGDRGRPRTGGIRIAHRTGAELVPVFLFVEPDRIRNLRFRGVNGVEYPYTTFRNTRYWITFLPPVSLADLPGDPGYGEYRKVADGLDAAAMEQKREFEAMIAREHARGDPRPIRRGGTRVRVAW